MEYQLNENVVLVFGAVNGAIYDFDTYKIYSVNRTALDIITKYADGSLLDKEERTYIRKLEESNLISNSFKPFVIETFEKPPTPKLEMAWLEITELCNLKCVHCYEGDCHKKFDNALDLEDWKKVIDQLSKLSVKRIILIGGEPCIYPKIIELIDYCGTKKIDTTLFTNATLMTDQLIESIKRNNTRVKISIYGGNQETHDKITSVKGSFKLMNSNIQKMKSLDIDIASSVILMKENQYELDCIKQYVKESGISYGGYDIIRNVFGGTQTEHTPNNQDIILPKYFCKPSFRANKDIYVKNHYVNSCWYGKIAIQENGNVLPCVFHRDVTMGNVKNSTIEQIIYSTNSMDYWYLPFDKVNECSCCEYRYACKDCRVMGIGIAGDIKEKNPRCLYSPQTGVWKKVD